MDDRITLNEIMEVIETAGRNVLDRRVSAVRDNRSIRLYLKNDWWGGAVEMWIEISHISSSYSSKPDSVSALFSMFYGLTVGYHELINEFGDPPIEISPDEFESGMEYVGNSAMASTMPLHRTQFNKGKNTLYVVDTVHLESKQVIQDALNVSDWEIVIAKWFNSLTKTDKYKDYFYDFLEDIVHTVLSNTRVERSDIEKEWGEDGWYADDDGSDGSSYTDSDTDDYDY